jgi:hypothetical protein
MMWNYAWVPVADDVSGNSLVMDHRKGDAQHGADAYALSV